MRVSCTFWLKKGPYQELCKSSIQRTFLSYSSIKTYVVYTEHANSNSTHNMHLVENEEYHHHLWVGEKSILLKATCMMEK